jgi:hypothetical protein
VSAIWYDLKQSCEVKSQPGVEPMNKKILAVACLACGLLLSGHAAAAAPARSKKAKPHSTKRDRLNETQARLIASQERELQQLRDLLQQMKAAPARDPGPTYPYTYP